MVKKRCCQKKNSQTKGTFAKKNFAEKKICQKKRNLAKVKISLKNDCGWKKVFVKKKVFEKKNWLKIFSCCNDIFAKKNLVETKIPQKK